MLQNIKETKKQVMLLQVQERRQMLDRKSQSNRIVKLRGSIMVPNELEKVVFQRQLPVIKESNTEVNLNAVELALTADFSFS